MTMTMTRIGTKMKLEHLQEASYHGQKQLPPKLANLFDKYFESDGDFEEEGWDEWYPLVETRWDKRDEGRVDYDNEVAFISGPNEDGQFNIHIPEDGPLATPTEILKYIYFK